MEEFGQQLVVSFLVLAITFAGPAVAIVMLLRRKRAGLAVRRSPLTEDLLRGPGHSLRKKLEESRIDVAFDLTALMVIPNTLLAFYLLHLQFRRTPARPWVYVTLGLLGLLIIGWSIRSLLRKSREMDKLRKGLDAEIAVGQELDQLMRQGAAVFHDFPAEKFNIDHVVIAPEGVFCVETKGYSKPVDKGGRAVAQVDFDGNMLHFPNWQTAKPIEQAERNAQWFGKWLAASTGTEMPITPVLALPGWYVNRKGFGAVRVFSGKALSSLLKAGTPNSLSPENVMRAIHQVEQRCRDVKPTYRLVD